MSLAKSGIKVWNVSIWFIQSNLACRDLGCVHLDSGLTATTANNTSCPFRPSQGLCNRRRPDSVLRIQVQSRHRCTFIRWLMAFGFHSFAKFIDPLSPIIGLCLELVLNVRRSCTSLQETTLETSAFCNIGWEFEFSESRLPPYSISTTGLVISLSIGWASSIFFGDSFHNMSIQ